VHDQPGVDAETFVGLMAPEGYIEWPYRPAGVPARLPGRAEIRRFLTEAVIVEYEAHGTVIATGAPFQQTVIAVFRVRNGQILSYRDYINPLPLAEALAGVSGATHGNQSSVLRSTAFGHGRELTLLIARGRAVSSDGPEVRPA
jgi:hypothetical protein